MRSILSSSLKPAEAYEPLELGYGEGNESGAELSFHRSGKQRSNQNLLEAPLLSSSSPTQQGTKKTYCNYDTNVWTSIFNLANNVAGAGILTLSAAMASGTGWVPSILICSLLSMASSHTFTLIGAACALTGQSNFKGLWSCAFGDSYAFFLDFAIFCQCFFSSIIYCGLLGDIFAALFPLIGFTINRPTVIAMFGSCLLLPLCLIRNLSSLGFTSILGFVAVLYTVIFITLRSIDGTYSIEGNGKFIDDQILDMPSFVKSSLWNVDSTSLVLCANLGLAFVAHYNAPVYWREFHNATIKTFGEMVQSSYFILAILYTITMCAGYATFGDNCRGNILLNYHPNDHLATFGRFATGLSVTFGFPLVFCGARDGLKGVANSLGYSSLSNPRNNNYVILSLLTVVCFLAMCITDIKFIAGFSGALMGSFLTYICPTLMYIKIVHQVQGSSSKAYRVSLLNLTFVPFGILVAVIGVFVTIRDAMQ